MKIFLLKRTGFILLFLGLLLCTMQSIAQFSATNIETGKYYSAVAKDNSNNIYVTRYNGTNYEVAKYTNGTGTPTVIYSNLSAAPGASPWGLTVNANGDVFVTNIDLPSHWQIIKLTAPAYTPSVIHSGNYYSALGLDQNNNLLSMEYNSGTNTYQLVRYPAGAENSTGTVLYNGLAYPPTGGPVIDDTYPWGIVSDQSNNIYILDFHSHNGGQLIKLTAPTFTPTVLASNKFYTALAIDAADNIYTTEGVNATTAHVMKYTNPAAAGTELYTGLTTATSAYPWGLAVTSNGNVYVGEYESATHGRLIKLAPPSITVTAVNRSNSSPTAANTVNYAVTFSGAASNVTTSSFSLTTTGSVTGASISSVTGSGTIYFVTVNAGTGDGTVRLDVNGTGITPVVSNVPYTSGQVYTIDRTAPTGTLTINTGAAITNNTAVTLGISATDNSAMQMRFSNDNFSWSAYQSFATTTTWTLPAGDGTKTVYVQLVDAALNATTIQDDIILDQTAPNTTFTATPPNPANSALATFEFNGDETNCTFEGSLDGGAFTATSSPATFTGLTDGPHTFQVRAKDQAGNVDASPANYPWTIDATSPTITSVTVPANGYYKAGDVLNFAVNFSENVTVLNLPYLAVTIGSTTVQAGITGAASPSSLTFSYTVAPGDMDMNGITVTSLQLNGATIQDAVGNNANVTLHSVGNTSSVFVNTATPTATLSTAAPTLVNAPFTVTVTFSEVVTGFFAADVNTSNATVSNLSTANNITYTVLVTPVADGPVSVQVPASVAVNIGSNVNTASNTLSITYDATAPVVTSVNVPANGYYRTGDNLTFTVHYDEAVVVNTTSGTPYINLVLTTGTVQVPYLSGSGTNALQFQYTAVFGDEDLNGVTVTTLQLNSGTIRDAAGNNANPILSNVGNTTGVLVNTAPPTVALSTTAPTLVNVPYTATITFSEIVTGFTTSDITATNATLSNLQTTDNITYTVLVTPAANGAVQLQVPANVAQNVGGNGNDFSNTLTNTYDGIAPVITSVVVPTNGYYKAGNTLIFSVNFSENVVLNTTGGTPYLTVVLNSGTVQAALVSATGNTLTFGYNVQNGDMDMDGIALGANLQLNSATIRDAATNNALVTLQSVNPTNNVFVNTAHPTVTLSTTAPAQVNAPFTITVVFNEAVTGLTAAGFSTTNATLSNLQTTDNITYTVLVTPTTDGAVSIQLPANVAVNIGNNGNTASNTITVTRDATAPVIITVGVPNNGYYKAGTILNFTVFFNEPITLNTTGGSPYLNLVLTTGTVQATFTSANATAIGFQYTVQNGDMDMNGIALGANLQLNNATITDAATNNANVTLQNVAPTNNVFVNTAHPSVILSTTAASRVNAPFTVTATFNEAVTGLTAAGFTTTNATTSNLQTTDNITYTVVVTPIADGLVSIQLPVNVAQNIGGNDNTASNTITLTRDATAPVITAAQSFSILQNSPTSTVIGQLLATDALGTVQNYTITSDPSGGAFAINATTGTITVNNGTILNNNVGNTVAVLVTVSDGLNVSTATAVSIKVNAINKAPILDAINNVIVCATTTAHTIQLTGASPVEPTQTYTLSIASNQAYFSALTVSQAGLINYQLNNNVPAGIATITVTIKDNGGTLNGGVDTYQRTFTITVNSLPVVTIASDKGNSVSKGDIVHLTATGGATYNWDANSSILNGQQAAMAEVRPQANTTYHVTATNANGCSSDASFNLSIIEDFKVDATNILTPNGDGKNDKWVIRNIDSYPDNELKIFDRSGRLVYSQRNYNNTWDGTLNGHPLAEGTYYYYLSISGGAKTAKGFITIILKAN